MRQIIIDTETTGLEPKDGHRVIEIGCVELINRRFSNNNFHCYINPCREIDAEALRIHGITNDFLRDKPTFEAIAPKFIEYINGAELVAHNASFDVRFLNHEIKLVDKCAKLLSAYTTTLDTLALARKMFPGQRNTLDALCKRYKISLNARKYHGALLDAQLLAEVYLLMTGGQSSLLDEPEFLVFDDIKKDSKIITNNKAQLLIQYASEDEVAAHDAFLSKIKKNSGKCIWEKK